MSTHEVGVWETLSGYESLLWGAAVVSMVADIVLTYHGIERGLVEGNPIARFALERVGYAALGALKLFALGVGLAGRAVLPTEYTAIVPLGLAVPWTIASLINAALIVTVS
ncbi:DUF5658 family protein [Halalkalicoccus sp. NIPERK01]|uniref:DUF5658 family protein n=1 Tax=Halalkalicoccus sp. NIPERK01 TaxID=3053469 RepID=UPI00256F20C8|nr:DUF5658 family protein [Halalkalicoccus sp. NIPERK01]MDL5363630.1 DUF5658 family protein [Halalkalicoccus sp. NIPERK01]